MNEQPSIMDKLLGLNWRTTMGGTLAAAGGVLVASAPTGSKWQVAGQIMAAVGAAWLGFAARDRGVSSAQMQDAADTKAQEGGKP